MRVRCWAQQAGEISMGSCIMTNGHACKVAVVSTSTGQHVKAHIVVLDITTGEYEDL